MRHAALMVVSGVLVVAVLLALALVGYVAVAHGLHELATAR